MNRIETGLKVALILFVVIAIVLGITTWAFKKQYDEAMAEKKTAMEKASVDAAAASKAKDDIEVLKRLIGYSDDISIIGDKFKEEMQKIAPEAENPTYVSVISSLQDKLNVYIKDLEQKTKSLATLNENFKKREASSARVLAQTKERVAIADKRLADLEAAHAKVLESNQEKVNTTIASTNALRKRENDRVAAADQRLELLDEALRDTNQLLADTRGKLKDQNQPPEIPQGKIMIVDVNGRTGTINLGSSVNVTKGLTFSVYDPRDMSEQGLKGSVEVINIEDARTSEVRISSLDMGDPIVSGDAIYTAGWSPGLQSHYALLGKMDVKDNGQHDLATVRGLIGRSNGILDAWQRDDGTQDGIITPKTTTIIIGTPPDHKSPAVFRDTYTNMLTQAERYGIKKIPLTDFLRDSSYRPQVDRTAGLQTSSRPRATSSGNVASIYSENAGESGSRRPRGSSAYDR